MPAIVIQKNRDYFKDLFQSKGFHQVQGFQKDTLIPGDETSFPKDGQTVLLHYTIWFLDGREYQTTREAKDGASGGTPTQHTLGKASLVRGLDLGLQQMSKGERAFIAISPELAFGKKGNPSGTIPPDTTLIWEVWLLDIRK